MHLLFCFVLFTKIVSPSSNDFFRKSSVKTNAPHGAPPPPHTHTLKNEAPPIVCEAPFHEMIPRNSNKQ